MLVDFGSFSTCPDIYLSILHHHHHHQSIKWNLFHAEGHSHSSSIFYSSCHLYNKTSSYCDCERNMYCFALPHLYRNCSWDKFRIKKSTKRCTRGKIIANCLTSCVCLLYVWYCCCDCYWCCCCIIGFTRAKTELKWKSNLVGSRADIVCSLCCLHLNPFPHQRWMYWLGLSDTFMMKRE